MHNLTECATNAWVRQADQAYQQVIHQETDVNTEQGIDEQ